jgi:hypothetical protein
LTKDTNWRAGLNTAADKLRFGENADVAAAEAFDTDAPHATHPGGFVLPASVSLMLGAGGFLGTDKRGSRLEAGTVLLVCMRNTHSATKLR